MTCHQTERGGCQAWSNPNYSTDDLRKNDAVREDVKAQVEGILDKFNW